MCSRLVHDLESRPPAVAKPRRRLGRIARALATLACGTFAAAPALAVAVSVTLTGADGQPVPSAEIDLGFGAKATTDEVGRATVEVAEEDLGRETEATITYTDPSTGERRTERRRLTMGPELRISVPTTQAPPKLPKRSKPLGRDLACSFAGAGFQIGFGAGTAEIEETPLDEQPFEFVFFVNGSEVDRTSGSKSAAELAETNRIEKKKHERDEIGPLFIRFPLVRGDSCRDPGLRIVPALRFGAGQADVEFTSTNVEMPGFSQSFSGDGWMYGGGFDLTLLRAEKRCVYGLGIEHWRSEAIDVRRSVDLASTFFGSGTMTLRDDARYEYESTSLRLTAGHAGDRFLSWVGFRFTWWEVELGQRSRLDISALFPTAPPGTEVVLDQRIVNRFDEDYVEAVAGIMAKLGKRAAVRAEGAVGEDSFEVKVGALLIF
jgi:hypothetical protein